MSKNANEKKSLYLTIKQQYFDAILAGIKDKEYREVKPTTIKRLLQLDDEGYEIEDENGNAIPIEYDALHLAVGYRPNRDEMLVEVKNAYCEIFVDREGRPIEYEAEGKMWLAEQVVYELGEILQLKASDKTKARAEALRKKKRG